MEKIPRNLSLQAEIDPPLVENTKHHLNLLARYSMSDAPKMDKMIVAGIQAKRSRKGVERKR
ncbi:hypothetical protein ICC18_18835 [Paenibacillus sp. WST5]|uniref:Uncharacterized protein n=1 Tax=Paenibacillus sedimenti TaxID=2770274 RepID=A0A926KTX8_9BACL|nr:hypothetical protein [Paenibacillus sedimenti]